MKPEWTTAQKCAIEARDSNILVSAAAGSGKTAVLVERVIRLITDPVNPVDIDKLLMVTFTNAASSEMKNKITRALREVIKENPNNSNARRQLSLLPNAKICSIDSFCMNLVRENFFNLNISQDFKVLDESEQELIQKLACDDVINELYEENHEEFKQLVELLSNTKSDDDLANAIMKITSFIMVQPFPFKWLDNLANLYDPSIPFSESVVKKEFYKNIHSIISECKKHIKSTLENMVDESHPKYQKFQEMIYDDKDKVDYVDRIINDETVEKPFKEIREYLTGIKFKSVPSKAEILLANNHYAVKELLPSILDYVSIDEDEYIDDCNKLYPIIKMLIEIVKKYYLKMKEYKDEKNAYTFSDIEHFAIELLFYLDDNDNIVRTQLAKDYESNFYEILVDEYQDTNNAQDMLFEQLSNGHNRFMVGDIKQSIYRFRLAMPQIFSHKKDTFEAYNKESNATSKKIILDKNFRSRKDICAFTNFMFSILMNREIGEVEYNEEEYLNPGAKYADSDIPSAQIKILECSENKPENEARQIAKLILDKINSKEQIDGRDIRFGDFAILFRSSTHFKTYTDVLTEYGIPVVSNNKANLFSNNEIAILVSFLRVIDNPIQDVPLLATILSPLYGYTPDDIVEAKLLNKGQNLYASISKCDIFKKFNEDLNKYRQYACSMSVASFIRQLISDTSYLSIISAMGNAEQRRLNVHKFISFAQNYDNGENIGLTSFMRYVDKVIDSNSNVESAEFVNTDSNNVTITTIHKSKGLEYPVVIFADTCHRYNKDDLKNNVLFDVDAGIGLKVHNEENLCRYNSMQYNYLKDHNAKAGMSENLRVLYVAVTRAKEQFISFITVNNIESKVSKLGAKIFDKGVSSLYTMNAGDDASFILWAALLHKDGKELRESAGLDNDFIISDFDLSIEKLDLLDELEEQTIEETDYDSEIVNEINDKLSYNYNRKELSSFISKRAASSLDDRDRGYEFFASSKPAFLEEDSMTSSQRGTAMHTFMQFCDYQNALNSINEEIIRLKELGHLDEKQANSLDVARLNNLFNSEFGQMILNADKIYREMKVSAFVPVNELEDTEFTDNVLVQGIADCVCEYNGELVLVDYKTDKVDNEDELLNRYKKQIEFYKLAVSKTLQKPIKKAVLYSFYLNKICEYK